MVLCCAVPLLIAGGALGVLGGLLRSWWLIGLAAVLVVGVIAWRVRRSTTRGQAGDDCCPPQRSDPRTDVDASQFPTGYRKEN
ncbi:MAG: hypothetical protein GEV07_14410 [Streptosporangiales bacterium]|nr:hypothetical protein [Streptosporangiales bacterium]